MKKNIITAVILCLITSLTGCDDFLDVVPRDKVSSDIVFNSDKSTGVVLNGVYDHMTYAAEGFFIYAPSLGIHNFIVSGDWMGQDVIPKSSITQWQADDYSFTSRGMEKDRPRFFWSYCYSHINVLNDLLARIPSMQGSPSAKKQIEGEARGLRAYNYFLLTQWFQQTYLIDPQAPGVPLYLESAIDPKPRASMEENFKAIIQDLQWAIQNMSEERRGGSKYVIGKDVAKGLLAKAYLEVGQYAEAKALAEELASKYPLMTEEEYKKGFSDVDVSECVWGLPVSTKNMNANYCLQTIWSHPRKHKRWSNNFVFLNDLFVELFSENDMRKGLISLNPVAGDAERYPERKYVSSKIMDPDDAQKLPDVLLMRSSEMILIQAECAARMNQSPEAQTILFRLQKHRDPNATVSTATGEELLDEILVERRKELYGEGFAIGDIKRMRKPLIRKGLHTIKGIGTTGVLYPADSHEFFLQIPQDEIQTNLEIIQNP